MKTNLAVASVVGAYLTFAALQEEPIQVWLVALAPLLLLAVGFVLHVGDRHEAGR
jgi:drug/metabolite transporter superfamily protein YnfA